MNENKRLLTLFGIVVAVILIILLVCFWPKADENFSCKVKGDSKYENLGSVNYEQYKCLKKEKSEIALVVADNLSTKEKKALNKAASSTSSSIYYLSSDIDSADLKTIKKELKYSDEAFSKDVVLVLKKGEVEAYKEDILSNSDDINSFLEENGLAKFTCDVESDSEYENLGAAEYDQYKCLYDSEKPFAIILAQTTCSYCAQFKPVIDEYASENNVPVYIIQINEMSDSDRQALLDSLSYFDDNDSWGTPLTLGIKNKKVVAEISGYTDDTDTIDSFFKDLGLK